MGYVDAPRHTCQISGWIQRTRDFNEVAHPPAKCAVVGEKSGLVHKRETSRIAEDSLQSFLFNHPESINWHLLDEDASFWVTDLIEAEKVKVNGAGTRSRANSRSVEGSREAAVSMPDDSASNAPEADPSADLVCRTPITERMAPVLSNRIRKERFRPPTPESGSQRNSGSPGCFLCVFCRVFQKTWATLLKDRRPQDPETEPALSTQRRSQ